MKQPHRFKMVLRNPPSWNRHVCTASAHQDGQGFELGIRVSWRIRSIGGIQVQKTNDLKELQATVRCGFFVVDNEVWREMMICWWVDAYMILISYLHLMAKCCQVIFWWTSVPQLSFFLFDMLLLKTRRVLDRTWFPIKTTVLNIDAWTLGISIYNIW